MDLPPPHQRVVGDEAAGGAAERQERATAAAATEDGGGVEERWRQACLLFFCSGDEGAEEGGQERGEIERVRMLLRAFDMAAPRATAREEGEQDVPLAPRDAAMLREQLGLTQETMTDEEYARFMRIKNAARQEAHVRVHARRGERVHAQILAACEQREHCSAAEMRAGARAFAAACRAETAVDRFVHGLSEMLVAQQREQPEHCMIWQVEEAEFIERDAAFVEAVVDALATVVLYDGRDRDANRFLFNVKPTVSDATLAYFCRQLPPVGRIAATHASSSVHLPSDERRTNRDGATDDALTTSEWFMDQCVML